MKIEATENTLNITAENDFDVIALNVWGSKKIRAYICTYKKNEYKYGDASKASGFLHITFEKVENGGK